MNSPDRPCRWDRLARCAGMGLSGGDGGKGPFRLGCRGSEQGGVRPGVGAGRWPGRRVPQFCWFLTRALCGVEYLPLGGRVRVVVSAPNGVGRTIAMAQIRSRASITARRITAGAVSLGVVLAGMAALPAAASAATPGAASGDVIVV